MAGKIIVRVGLGGGEKADFTVEGGAGKPFFGWRVGGGGLGGKVKLTSANVAVKNTKKHVYSSRLVEIVKGYF